VRRANSLFDKIYTFERDKTSILGAEYLPQFIPVGYKEANAYRYLQSADRQPRCFFLGRDKGRSESLAKLANILENAGCEIDFSVVKDRTSTKDSTYLIDQELDYSYSFLKTLMSDVVIDIVQKGQTGWTLRVLEAFYLNKKIITNNTDLLNSEFYSEGRIFILGIRDSSEISDSLTHNLSPLEPEFLYKYSPDNMLSTIIQAWGN
jgi:1,5-rhamnosyltransferase